MIEDWIPVNIRQCAPSLVLNRATFAHVLTIDGQDVDQWMLDNHIHWTYDFSNWPVLRFKREEDAALFKLRWL
jgi:hypothetical protein